jgi:phage portal protein BeeE
MPTLLDMLRGRAPSGGERRYSFDDWANDKMLFGGMSYPLVGLGSLGNRTEEIGQSFAGYVQGAYKANGVIFSVVLARLLLFAEARFQWQRLSGGKPGDLFGTPELGVLERPWPGGTTGELLARMEQDVSLDGNAFVAREGSRLRRRRPDWVSIILSAPPDEATEADVVGYLYRPGGLGSRNDATVYLPGELAHWSPIPDPTAEYRGMSWLTPITREVIADKAMTTHKQRFLDNGAKPGLVVSFKETVTADQFKDFIAKLDASHVGVDNAYKTLYVGGGADVTVAGADLRQLDFKLVQGAGETRICAAGGVPPIIVGLSEGLQAATYSNYSSARRKFGDHWARPTWRSACAALESILTPPARDGTVRLWYDDRDIAFLREDQKDAAEIQQIKAAAIRQLVDAGFDPASVVAAVEADDRTLLQHSGLYSVQLQPPGTGQPTSGGIGA